uniref:Mab-21 domain-containing protein n=1 Tax=Angiostrongylus cantonensis TaxID=6313 RepID=A0A158P8W7_ANGCA
MLYKELANGLHSGVIRHIYIEGVDVEGLYHVRVIGLRVTAKQLLADFDNACGKIGLCPDLAKTMFVENGFVSDVSFMLYGGHSKTHVRTGVRGEQPSLRLLMNKGIDVRWRTQIEYGLQLLVLLIDDWGIEFREKLLDHCLPLASSLVHDLDFSAASPISLNSTWPFFDRLFHLAVPDCKPSCLVRCEAYYLAQSACEVIIKLVVIADNNHSNGLDHSVIAYTRNTKRRKVQKFLDVINDWSSVDNTEYNEHRRLVVSWLFVGYEIASRWSHRVESDCLTSMATKLWAGRDRIKLDWQCGPYCRLLDILLRKGALDTLCNEELEVIGDESDITDVICDIFSRWFTPHCPVLYNLVATLLTEFEFDEFAPFPGVTDKKKGLKEWRFESYKCCNFGAILGILSKYLRFRCQIAEWLITNVEPQCSLEELLLLLCSFHPCRTSAVSSVPICFPAKVQIERDLISFGLCEKCILPSDDKPTIPFVVIPEMVDYISGVIKQFWTDQENRLKAMNHWMSTFALEANADVLSQIRAQELSSELIPLDLLTILATRLDDCPSLAMHLLIHEVQLQISSRNIVRETTIHIRLSSF